MIQRHRIGYSTMACFFVGAYVIDISFFIVVSIYIELPFVLLSDCFIYFLCQFYQLAAGSNGVHRREKINRVFEKEKKGEGRKWKGNTSVVKQTAQLNTHAF